MCSPPALPLRVRLYTLVPEMLVGRNRVPEGEAVEFFPPAYRTPVFIKQLPEVDNPSADAELLALKPDVYIDYGTVHEDYIAALNRGSAAYPQCRASFSSDGAAYAHTGDIPSSGCGARRGHAR